jgi:hypothetical protein
MLVVDTYCGVLQVLIYNKLLCFEPKLPCWNLWNLIVKTSHEAVKTSHETVKTSHETIKSNLFYVKSGINACEVPHN